MLPYESQKRRGRVGAEIVGIWFSSRRLRWKRVDDTSAIVLKFKESQQQRHTTQKLTCSITRAQYMFPSVPPHIRFMVYSFLLLAYCSKPQTSR